MKVSYQEAQKNEEIVALADSQVMRFLDELNGIDPVEAECKVRSIRRELKSIKKQPKSYENRQAIKALYSSLDNIQFVPDYMCLVVDKVADYRRACKGFKINGISYSRLLGTPGGIKNSTVVFVNSKHKEELQKRIDNGRDMTKKIVPAKFEAYRGLSCSASMPVSDPKGILVVPDCRTTFASDYIELSNADDKDEPEMRYVDNGEISLVGSDGFGLMLPALAERWSEDLSLPYLLPGCCIRNSFCKGMVFTFDFLDFANSVAKQSIVTDAWGHEHNINDIELVLTTSMLKLWDSYGSIEDYLRNCKENHYTFAVTKTCDEYLDSSRVLNYQFIQSYKLDDAAIDELIRPTINEIKDVLGGDVNKTILFLKGMSINENNIAAVDDDFAKAIMIDDRVINDQHVANRVHHMIQRRIDEAKIGVVRIHGNFSVVCGDPYALCQSIFGLEVTGLLKAGEVYNAYWSNSDAEKLVCFRAPMTCMNNIKSIVPHRSALASYWYKYMTTVTILNVWDSICHALNGMD